jgi:hypothetical protein
MPRRRPAGPRRTPWPQRRRALRNHRQRFRIRWSRRLERRVSGGRVAGGALAGLRDRQAPAADSPFPSYCIGAPKMGTITAAACRRAVTVPAERLVCGMQRAVTGPGARLASPAAVRLFATIVALMLVAWLAARGVLSSPLRRGGHRWEPRDPVLGDRSARAASRRAAARGMRRDRSQRGRARRRRFADVLARSHGI